MLDLLYAAANDGTGRRAALAIPTFGKTGTTQENRDALFIGFAGDLVVGVWVGRDDNTSLGKVSGGTLPAQIWHNFMVSAVAVDQRRDNSESKSPLPDDWSKSTKDLRDIGKWVDDLLGDG
jgi:penicillin-binding protein 1A